MKKRNMLIGMALVMSLAMMSPAGVLAGEHGGKEHGGEKHAGGMHEGSHGMTQEHENTLKEAAQLARQSGREDLAEKLDEMAKMKG